MNQTTSSSQGVRRDALASKSSPALQASPGENIEVAGRLVEQSLNEDDSYMELSGQLRIATHGIQTLTSAARLL